MTLRKETGRTLRDELEAKLRKIYFKAETDVFGLLADECIRQMEYNWRTGFDSCCNRGMVPSPAPDPVGGDYSLQLAPEDWKP